jgi:hypothetical protein
MNKVFRYSYLSISVPELRISVLVSSMVLDKATVIQLND